MTMFYKAGRFLYKKGYVFFRKRGKAEEYLDILYPRENTMQLAKEYYERKLGMVCKLAFLIIVTAIAVSIIGDYAKQLESVMRQTEEKEINLNVHMEDWKGNVNFTMAPREYTEGELEEMLLEVLPKLDTLVLGNNVSSEEIKEALCFPERIEGYPFLIQWESENFRLIRTDGTVCNEEVQEGGERVNIFAILTYGDFKRRYSFPVVVLQPDYTKEQTVQNRLLQELEKADKDNRSKEFLPLPEKIDGQAVEWKTKQGKNGMLILGIGAASLFFCWRGEDEKLKKKMKQRQREMSEEYPEIISKLTLLLGAGLPIREAIKRIGEKGKGAAYEELAVVSAEIEAGVSEGRAYLHWGKRCRLGQYRKLSTLLVQNLKKGSKGLLLQLEREAENALEEKRAEARKLGEEAGTKLLLPMMGMLLVVMVFVIVPAFGNF